MQDEQVEASEVAILGLIQTYFECSVNNNSFDNSTTNCSEGTVTFSSTLAYASDDGSVTATVLIEMFEAALINDEHVTITVDGQELVVSIYPPIDDDNNLVPTNNHSSLVGPTYPVDLGSSAIIMIILFVIIW